MIHILHPPMPVVAVAVIHMVQEEEGISPQEDITEVERHLPPVRGEEEMKTEEYHQYVLVVTAKVEE